MMFVLACEGKSEVFLAKSLMAFGHLSLPGEIFLDGPIVMRQFGKYLPILSLVPINEDIRVLRIGDTQRDIFSTKGLELREGHISIETYCTKPEVEILVIIREGLYKQYAKVSREMTPKQFIKSMFHDFSPEEYFEKNDMYDSIMEHKRIRNHEKGELFLADLLHK